MSDAPIDPARQPEPPAGPGDAETGGSTNNDVSDTVTSGTTVPEADAPASSSAPPTEARRAAEAPLQGKVVRVTSEQVIVDLDEGRQGFVPMIEFVGQPIPQEGDEVSVMVERVDAEGGLLALSKRQADELTFWESVKPGDVLEGVVTGMNKGGLDVDIGGARAFLPASQVDVRRIRDISLLIGEHVRCVVTQVDRTTRDLVASRKKYIEKERKEQRAQRLNDLVEGESKTGTVSTITEYGAFIDLGGVQGLLHLTDMSWSRVRSPRDVVQEGQQLEVRILKVNRETGKVSLGLKQLKPDPWDGIEERYPPGKRIKARVVRMADFGAFLEVQESVEALLPLSETSWSRRINHPSELLNVGDTPEVVVLKVDPDRRRISVGLKQTQENPWATVEDRFPANKMVTGKVSKVADFGAFVELAPGVEGMAHISELSAKHVKAVSDVVREGQEVEVRVLTVDPQAQRISLSMKPEPRASRAASGGDASDRLKKKRKKPLRGGLASHFQWW